MKIRIAVVSAEVATLKADGRPWDGPGGSRIPKQQREEFFGLSLSHQLDRLVQTGSPPTPPDVFVRLYDGDKLLIETGEVKSFDPSWSEEATEFDVDDDAVLKLQVWDRDVLFDDPIGETDLSVAHLPSEGRYPIGPFQQVRGLVLRLG